MAYVPGIGVAGLYQLKAPYDAQLLPNVRYSCEGVRTLQELSANGEGAFEKVYEPFGLTQDDFNRDVVDGARIVVLQAEQGNRIELPSTYIVGMPDVSGVPYMNLILAMNLSILPASMNLDYLKSRLAAVVLETIGVPVTVDTITGSPPTDMRQEQHAVMEATRKLRMTATESDYAKYVRVDRENAQLRQKVGYMEDWIKKHKPS